MTIRREGRRWFAPEVVQTSAMDCGPAALNSVAERSFSLLNLVEMLYQPST